MRFLHRLGAAALFFTLWLWLGLILSNLLDQAIGDLVHTVDTHGLENRILTHIGFAAAFVLARTIDDVCQLGLFDGNPLS